MKTVSPLRTVVMFAFVLVAVAGRGQAQSVEFDINFPNYDVLYLSDFVDIRNVSLAPNIPDVSFEIRSLSPTPFDVVLRVRAEIQLKGDAAPTELVRAQSDPFSLTGPRRFSSRNLSGISVDDIKFRGPSKDQISPETKALRERLQDYVYRFPTAPVGQYTFEILAFSPGNLNSPIGRLRRTVTIRNASESEVNVTLISPESGAIVPTPFPTFTWTSEKPEVVLNVYEKLPIHRSPQEAVTGIPYLRRELTGISTFTYPADAERRLENGKSYYWFVETKVLTSRGTLSRQSEIRLFRVLAGGASPLARLLNNLPGNAGSTLGQLLSEGWTAAGAITLDGKPVSQEELAALFQQLTRDNVEVNVSIEEQ